MLRDFATSHPVLIACIIVGLMVIMLSPLVLRVEDRLNSPRVELLTPYQNLRVNLRVLIETLAIPDLMITTDFRRQCDHLVDVAQDVLAKMAQTAYGTDPMATAGAIIDARNITGMVIKCQRVLNEVMDEGPSRLQLV